MMRRQRTSTQSSTRKWIARAHLISLTVSIVFIIADAQEEFHIRRRLEDEGEDNKVAAQAALSALEQALGVLDEIIAVQDSNGHNAPAGDQDQPSAFAEGGAQDQEQAVQNSQDGQQGVSSNQEQQAQELSQNQADTDMLTEQTQQGPDDESIKKKAAEALGETTRNHREEAPQPIQSREKYFGKVFPETNHVEMPFYLRNTFEPTPTKPENRDIVFHWHIPKTAGILVKNVMGMCYGLKRAEKLKEPASLELVHDVIVNVDTSSPEGISEAHELGLVDSDMVDFISSSFILSASSLFTPQHRGRAFTILRHPIDAAAHNFHARKVKHPDLRGKYTLAQYASKNYYIDNWVTRQLTGTLPHETLERRHVDQAKNILAAKFFVGIYEHMDETMRQLKAFYKWKALEGQEYCVTDLIHGSNPKFQKTYRGKPARGSNDWAFVANVEKWDMELYYFGLEMFSKQGRIWDADEYSLIETESDGKSY